MSSSVESFSRDEVSRRLRDSEQSEGVYDDLAAQMWQMLTGAERDTLLCLVEKGPVWDGDLPSKDARSSLIELGLASKAVSNGKTGYQVANYDGWAVSKAGAPRGLEGLR